MSAQQPLEAPNFFDVEIEQALIGSCLADDFVAREAEGLVRAADFMDPLHQRIWEAIGFLLAQAGLATPLTVAARLASDPGLIEVGGKRYLNSLALGSSPIPNFKDYARIIVDMAARRRLDGELEAARDRLCSFDVPVTECIADVVSEAGAAAEVEARDAGYLALPDAIDEVMKEAESAANGVKPEAVMTGLKDLDRMLGGFQSGDMVVVAGRPGQGKTVVLSGIALAAAKAGRPSIIFELEMRRRQILHRMFCDIDFDHRGEKQKPLSYQRMRSGHLADGEFERMERSANYLRTQPIKLFDTAGMTIDEMGSHAQRFADRSKVMGVIIIDYLQIIVAGDTYAGSKVAEMTDISNKIKRMAKRIGWPVVVGSQLNREVEKREIPRPILSDLRETGAIEQDADIAIGLYRPAYYVARRKPEKGKAAHNWLDWKQQECEAENVLELGVIKNRSGADGLVKCFVNIGASAVRDWSYNNSYVDPGQELLPYYDNPES